MGYISVYNPVNWVHSKCLYCTKTCQKHKNIPVTLDSTVARIWLWAPNHVIITSLTIFNNSPYVPACSLNIHILQKCNTNTNYMMLIVHHIQSLISAEESILRCNCWSSGQATPFLSQIFITMLTRACCHWPLSWVSPHHYILVLYDPFSYPTSVFAYISQKSLPFEFSD